MKPEDAVGKYIAYDCDHGACWAKIDSVAKSGERTVLITSYMRVRHNMEIQTFTEKRCLFWESLRNAKIFDMNNMSEEADDALFVELLGSDGDERNASAVALGHGTSEILKKLRVKTKDTQKRSRKKKSEVIAFVEGDNVPKWKKGEIPKA
jgi:hypothetical protein